jgi:hypothetical protein
MQMFGDGSNQAAFNFKIFLPLNKSRKRLVEQTLQCGDLLLDRTHATFEITLNLASQTIFKMSVDHSSLLRVVVLI